MQKVVIIGGGEHSKVLERSCSNLKVLGYIDRVDTGVGNYLGDDKKLHELANEIPDLKFIWGIGSVKIKYKLFKLYGIPASRFLTVIHETAVICSGVNIGYGAFVGPGAIVQSNTIIQDHCILNTGVIIEHDCVVSSFSHIAPGAIVGGGCDIGMRTFVGLGARVSDHITIGRDSIVGAGSVVINNVNSDKTVVGIPAKLVKSNE